MKKTIFTLLVTLASFGAFAQFEQGTMLVGGEFGVGFSTSKTKFDGRTDTNGKSTDFTLNPNFGYFIIDNLAVGAELGVMLNSYKPENTDGKSTETALTFGPFVRYYFPVKIFLQGSAGIGTSKTKDDYNGDVDEDKFSIFGSSLGAGYAIMLNDNVALEPMVGYESIAYKNKTSGEPAYKNVNSGLFLRLGFQIYLR
jgi:outer membrane protein